MTGQPELNATNTYLGIDATALDTFDPGGASTQVVERALGFDVAMRFALAGSFANWLVGLSVPSNPIAFTVTYTFTGRGVPDGPNLTCSGNLQPGKLVYEQPDTRVNVPPNTLAPGLYELGAYVTFGGNPPMAAFIEVPLIEVIGP
jgi:hypothetical protein